MNRVAAVLVLTVSLPILLALLGGSWTTCPPVVQDPTETSGQPGGTPRGIWPSGTARGPATRAAAPPVAPGGPRPGETSWTHEPGRLTLAVGRTGVPPEGRVG